MSHFTGLIFNEGHDERTLAEVRDIALERVPADIAEQVKHSPRARALLTVAATAEAGVITIEFAEFAMELLKRDEELVAI